MGGEGLGRLPVTEPERPKAPWHPFPLVELCVLAGIVLLVLGLVNYDTEPGRAMLVAGMLLGSLGGLDTALREHFAGYRSHTTILAGLVGVALAAALYFAQAPWPAVVAGAVVGCGVACWLLVGAYRRRER